MSNWVRADDVKKAIDSLPQRVVHDYGEYVSRELYNQMVGERDIAISQLEDLGISFGQNPRLVAIPIEWIKNQIVALEGDVEYERIELDEFGEAHQKQWAWKCLIEEWEKQHEIDRC